jgi:MerR family transcriptional regulator, light-induced transcriptional regulator
MKVPTIRLDRSGVSRLLEGRLVSRLLEGRPLTLARGWNKGPSPRAILACPPGEQHTLPLLGFGLALRSRGWRNIYLGADTPPSTIHMAADTAGANMIALAAVSIARFLSITEELRALARARRWCWPAPGRHSSWQRTSGSTTSTRTR